MLSLQILGRQKSISVAQNSLNLIQCGMLIHWLASVVVVVM
jgi:hypothetical protein